jgi:hypothetical protein
MTLRDKMSTSFQGLLATAVVLSASVVVLGGQSELSRTLF